MPTRRLESIALWTSVSVGAAWLVLHVRRTRQRNTYAIPSVLLQSPYAAELQMAVHLALKAGANMTGYCNEKGTKAEAQHDLGISTKGNPEDFCTKIDVENEQLVTEGILAAFRSHKIIGEESTGTGIIPQLTSAPTWIIDPIDGTTNFSSALPLTCVSIGFCVGAEPVLGVVFAPMTSELYLAVRGFGAFRNGVRLIRGPAKCLRQATVCYEYGYERGKDGIAKMLGSIQKILEHGCRSIRTLGSGVLDLCYVATGRLDVVYAGVAGEGWKPWDYCAASVIISEVGCVMESIDQQPGEPFDLYATSIICGTSRELVDDIRTLIAS